MNIPKIGEALNQDDIKLLNTVAKSCRNSIVGMVTNAQSGHPGGACSVIDYLTLIYSFIISQTGDDVIVSNGHVSAGVYAILAEMGYIPREEVIRDFRKVGKIYEGHITRHVPGVTYGTGPLGIGVSAAAGFALAEKVKKSDKRIFSLVGDGECGEGQVYEMINFANQHQLSNYTLFIDHNQVQLSDKLKNIIDLNFKKIFEAANWNVIEADGHDFADMWSAISESYKSDRPTVIIGHTIMGKGVSFMEEDGKNYKPTWHGIAPKPEQAEEVLGGELKINNDEKLLLDNFRKDVKWQPEELEFPENFILMPEVNIGIPNILPAGTKADCRSSYGNALLDLAELNENIVAFAADVSGSVKTSIMKKEFPERHFDAGIAEQNMVSCAGGMSFAGYIPFCSTFGTFLSSRPKGQARMNDINRANVKMVATHCGLSVGEDGPTHQVVDEMGSYLGFFHTGILEPSDANQTDYIIRYIASHYGNFYVRMGRHKFNVILKEDGTPFYDENYNFEFGKADLIRTGSDVTVVAGGSMVANAVEVADKLKDEVSIEVIAVSSIKKIDLDTLLTSLEKTGRLITFEDHNPYSGLASQVNSVVAQEGLSVEINNMAVREYQLSGKSEELYKEAYISEQDLEDACKAIVF